MKRIGQGIAVLVVLLIVGVAAAWLNIDHIVKSEVESQATHSLRLETTLDAARVALLGGKIDLHGLDIASPRGFSERKMLEVGNVGVQVTWHELRQHPIHVGSLIVEKPKLVIEQANGAINFRKAMELMPEPDPKKPPMKLVIDEIQVKDAQVVIKPGLPGVQDQIVVNVPALSMKDVGRGKGAKNGAAIKDVAMQVITALAEKAAQSKGLPIELKALLHLNAADVAAQVPGLLEKAVGEAPASVLKGLLPQGRAPSGKKR